MEGMPGAHPGFDWLARHVGGPRVLAFPLLRGLAVVAGATWVALTPRSHEHWTALAVSVLLFFLYSAALGVGLWLRPGVVLGLNLYVLVTDLAFALILIGLAGAASALFLALLLVAGLQSYYYGIVRGTLVAVVSGLAYLVVAWPTIDEIGQEK